jgi:arylsulfatase A-like enzyme
VGRAPLDERARRELRALVRIEGGDPRTLAALERSPELLELAYDKGVERFDAVLAHFLAGLAAHGAAERAALIVTSDHGEALYTRGYGNHGQGLYDDEVAIPLAARLPGVSADAAVDCPVGLIDLLPTLCVYLGLDCPGPLFGRSWLPGRDPAPDARRYLVSEGVGSQPAHRAIRNRRWKLVWQPGRPPDGRRAQPYALFDTQADPQETTDLAGSQEPEIRAVLEGLTRALHAAVPEIERPAAERVPLDPELEARLRDLGYLAPAPPAGGS